MSDLISHLNSAQQQAVLHTTGPAVVLAGAGSGKTRVLTTRSAWLIQEQGLNPDEILLMTFTNKAAQEMSSRVQEMTGHRLPYSGTFHRICALILRRHAPEVGLDHNFVIYDAQDQEALIKQIYKDKGYNHKKYPHQTVRATISNAKNNLVTTSQFADSVESEYDQLVSKVYQQYQRRLTQSKAVDFDDLLFKTVTLFQQQPEILDRYQQQFIHVLVDEYQDTNRAQYELTKLLAQPQNNAYIVGDFSQSIYAWRGANYRNLEYFKQDFTKLAEYRLEQNYRSTQTILDAATQVISKNTGHPVLSLWTEQPLAEPITVLEANNNEHEAQLVLAEIRQLLKTYQPQDIAILYRTNAQSRAFEEAFIQEGMKYRIVGGFKFYERKEVKDVLAYLRIFANPVDQVSTERAVKLGKRRFASFQKWAKQNEDKIETPFAAIAGILKSTSYLEKYDTEDAQDQARIENVEELLNVAHNFTDINQFLENVALVQDDYLADVSPEEALNTVTMLSLHSAKGLEFPVVFIVGMEEGLLPHSRSLYDREQLEEERRLCYVGITRAKERLYFSYAKRRWQYGQSSHTVKSRFLGEIDASLLKNSLGKGEDKQRRVVLDDDLLDSLLNDELDLDAFLDS